jgi:hypothetical protein
LGVAKAMEASSQLTDGDRGIEQVLGGHGAEAADKFWLNDRQLPLEEIATVGGFRGGWIPITGRTALQDVENVHILAPQRAGFDDLVEQLTGAADKRFALPVFIRARGLAQEHEPGQRIPHAKYRLRTGGSQFATLLTRGDFSAHTSQRGCPLGKRR